MRGNPPGAANQREDIFHGTAVVHIHPQDGRTEHEGIVVKPAALMGIGGMEHIGRENEKISPGGGKQPAAAGKLARSLHHVIEFKFAVPVHGNIHEGVGEIAFVKAVRNIDSAVLPFLLCFFAR